MRQPQIRDLVCLNIFQPVDYVPTDNDIGDPHALMPVAFKGALGQSPPGREVGLGEAECTRTI